MYENDYEPEWVGFCKESFEKIDGKVIPKQKYKTFWDQVKDLNVKEKKCDCESNEMDSQGYCIKCFLDKNFISPHEFEVNGIEKDNWIWFEPRSDSKRWLCLPNSFYCKIINFEFENMCGSLFMNLHQGKIWTTIKWYFWCKQNQKCGGCFEKLDSFRKGDLHHIIPKSKGGRENEENLILLCPLCHRTKMIEIYK